MPETFFAARDRKLSTFHILYVEDNEYLRETMGMLMEADDRVIVACANGEDALEAAKDRKFDLVLTDISLPGISGTDLARSLLQHHPDYWIAFCSGYSFGEAVNELGVNVRTLNKPVDLEELEALIAEVRKIKGAQP